ncbi:unnamed protein product [Pleuronectes platessa]|uniref:Uncharacterized protein n=1 Tax=Pleuronectes platessa TaxID=8262 RepID=A0A9N7ZAR2_PLEPL|nr:unnamed protein product [Pleuronectes platessa]
MQFFSDLTRRRQRPPSVPWIEAGDFERRACASDERKHASATGKLNHDRLCGCHGTASVARLKQTYRRGVRTDKPVSDPQASSCLTGDILQRDCEEPREQSRSLETIKYGLEDRGDWGVMYMCQHGV